MVDMDEIEEEQHDNFISHFVHEIEDFLNCSTENENDLDITYIDDDYSDYSSTEEIHFEISDKLSENTWEVKSSLCPENNPTVHRKSVKKPRYT